MTNYYCARGSYLVHYGVKGMKWGVGRTPEQLGHKKSVAKSQNSGIIKNEIIMEAIRSGKVSKTVNREKQTRHTLHGRKKGRSYIDGDLEYAQQLIDRLHGTGTPIIVNGVWAQKERVYDSHIIGTYVDRKGEEIKPTKR